MRGVWRWKSYHLSWSPWESLKNRVHSWRRSFQILQGMWYPWCPGDGTRFGSPQIDLDIFGSFSGFPFFFKLFQIFSNFFKRFQTFSNFFKLFQAFTCDRGFKPGSHHAKHSKSQTVRWHLEIVHVQTMIQTSSNSFYVERVWESGNNRLSQVGLRLMWRLEDGPGFSFLDTIWQIMTDHSERKENIPSPSKFHGLGCMILIWYCMIHSMILHDAAWCCSLCILRQKVQELGIQLEDQARQALASLPHEHAEELLEQLGRNSINSAQQLPNRLGSIQILCIFPQSVIYLCLQMYSTNILHNNA